MTRQTRSTFHAPGLNAFDRTVVDRIPADGAFSLEYDLTAELIGAEQFRAFRVAQRFYDIGTFERLALAEPIFGRPSGSPCRGGWAEGSLLRCSA